jgi:hypothetical protein
VAVTWSQALLVFLGIPVLSIAVISLCVVGASWFKSSWQADGSATGPIFVTSASGIPDPTSLPRELSLRGSVAGGGASGRW